MTDLPAAAITAAAEAIDDEYHHATQRRIPGWSRDLAIAAVEAAAPHITAAATAADPTTENEGFRAYKAGAAAERERIAQSSDLRLVIGFARGTGGKPRAVREALSRLDADLLLEDTP